MRDQDQRALIGGQPLLQPEGGVQVKVVSGLIEKQQFRGRHQRARQGQPDTPSTGKILDPAAVIPGRESKPQHHEFGPAFDVIAIRRFQACMQRRRPFEVPCSLCLRDGSAYPGNLLMAADQIVNSCQRDRFYLLGHRCNLHAGQAFDVAGIRRELAGEQCEQTGFAAAICARQCEVLAWLDGQIDVLQ